ncbi:hypothetical protein V1511DRAFT_513555 [Dipodascopsis uninucleata]
MQLKDYISSDLLVDVYQNMSVILGFDSTDTMEPLIIGTTMAKQSSFTSSEGLSVAFATSLSKTSQIQIHIVHMLMNFMYMLRNKLIEIIGIVMKNLDTEARLIIFILVIILASFIILVISSSNDTDSVFDPQARFYTEEQLLVDNDCLYRSMLIQYRDNAEEKSSIDNNGLKSSIFLKSIPCPEYMV